jgi:hypothetical protein
MNKHIAIVFAAMLLIGGASFADTAAVAQFEQKANACKQAMSAPLIHVSHLTNGKWHKREEQLHGQVQYDVRKSDSLVSSLIGEITFTLLAAGAYAESEEAAKAIALDPKNGKAVKMDITLRFAYRAGAWEPVDGEQTTQFRSAPGQPFRDTTRNKLPAQSYSSPLEPTARCLTDRSSAS